MLSERPRRLGAGAASFLLLSSLACASARAPQAAKAPAPEAARAAGRLELIEAGAGLPRSGQWRHSFALADLDGDGRLDLAHGPARKGARRPVVFLGDGKGGFRRWDEAKYPAFPYDYGGIAAGDVDGDGRTDLALGVHMLGVAVLLQKEPGVFSLSVEGLPLRGQGTGPAFSSRAVALADADGDGKLDLLALSEGPLSPGAASGAQPVGVALFLGRGGAWQRTAEGPAPDTAFGSGLVSGDLNGDGVPDLLVATSVQGDRRILRLGNREGASSFLPVELTDLPERAFVLAAGFGDFDADGRLDLAVSTLVPGKEGLVSRVDVLLSRPSGFESRPVLSEPGRHPRGAVAAGDLNGDGRTDLALLGGDGKLETWLGDGRGGFAPAARVAPPAERIGCAGYHVAVRDLDGDGLGDVVAAFAGEGSASDPDAPCLSAGALVAWRSSVPGR
ncbi:MAG: VCBS repeat-containing protein [Holophagales bacterium]|nr:VCBS repeat-containing protein [Holophagales bacterium]